MTPWLTLADDGRTLVRTNKRRTPMKAGGLVTLPGGSNVLRFDGLQAVLGGEVVEARWTIVGSRSPAGPLAFYSPTETSRKELDQLTNRTLQRARMLAAAQ